MAKNVIGIDISDASIEAVSVQKKKGRFEVEAYSRFRLSPDIVDDGRIIDPDKLREAIIKMLQNGQPHGMEKYRRVIFSVPESKVFSRIFSLPKSLKEKEIKEAIYHQAEGSIPDTFDNLISTFKILPEKNDSREVLFFASPISVLKDFLELFKSLNISVEAIVPEAVSSFSGLDEKFEKATTLLLDIGSRTTIATIFDKNGIKDSINIPIGGNSINQALMAKLGVSYSIAEEKKRQIGLSAENDGEVMLIVQGQLQPLTDEIKRFIDYYEQFNNQKVEQLVIIGGLAQMKGIDNYFGENLSLPGYIGESFIQNKFLPPYLVATKYINALGLAKLAYKKPEIDFLPGLLKEEASDNSLKDLPPVNENLDKTSSFATKLKSFFKNKNFLVLLLLVILMTLLFVFKDRFYLLFNPSANKTPLESSQATVDDSNILAKPIKNISKDFVVGDVYKSANNFILGEYYYIELEKSAANMNYSYDELLEFMATSARDEILSNIQFYFQKDGFEIIPYAIDYQESNISVGAEEFVDGQDLSAIFRYRFLVFAKEKLAALLAADGFEININNWPKIDYQIINSNINQGGASFNLRATVDN